MILKLLYLGNLLSIAFMPILLAPKLKPYLFGFCLRMSLSDKFRKCYRLMLLAIVMMQHLYYLSLFQNHYNLMVSTVIALVFLSSKKADRIFAFLQSKKRFIAFAIVTVILSFVPHCSMIAFVFGVILFGSGCYPSQYIMLSCSDRDERRKLIDDPELFVERYFCWSKMTTILCQGIINDSSRLADFQTHKFK